MKQFTGSKGIQGLPHKIINLIPTHQFYYELFAGSAAIAQLLPHSKNKVLTDINPDTIEYLKKTYTGGGIIENLDALPTLKSLHGKDKSTFVFLDPTYMKATTSEDRYEYTLNDTDHVELLTTSLQMKFNIMIIHPACKLYDSMLSNWYWKTITVRYHKKNCITRLYMNYPPPLKLHTTQYLGNGRTDRQRIKRKGDRWISKLTNMAPLEQQYILEKIKEMI